MLKENIMKIRGINDNLVKISGGKTSAGKVVKNGTLGKAIRNLMTDFQTDRYNGQSDTQWDINRVDDFNKAGISIKQAIQSEMQKKGAIDLTASEKVIISNIRKFQVNGGIIDDDTTWYEVKNANKPVISDERKKLNKEIRQISDKNVQKMVDLFRAYNTAKEQFDTLIANLNAPKKQGKKANKK